jgi:hypothetical protein
LYEKGKNLNTRIGLRICLAGGRIGIEEIDTRTACRDVETGGRLWDLGVKWIIYWLKI